MFHNEIVFKVLTLTRLLWTDGWLTEIRIRSEFLSHQTTRDILQGDRHGLTRQFMQRAMKIYKEFVDQQQQSSRLESRKHKFFCKQRES